MKQNQIESFLYNFSRYLIIIPIVILIGAIVFKVNQITIQSKSAKVVQNIPTPHISPTTNNSITLDLNGPYICQSDAENLDIYVKNKQLLLKQQKESNITETLLKEDCLYRWNSNSSTGEKVCGLGQYVTMLDSLLKSNLIDLSTLIKVAQQNGFSSASKEADIKSIMKTCKKEEINEEIFEIPSSIRFIEQKVITPTLNP